MGDPAFRVNMKIETQAETDFHTRLTRVGISPSMKPAHGPFCLQLFQVSPNRGNVSPELGAELGHIDVTAFQQKLANMLPAFCALPPAAV
jgi:hypothetical protein